jgi:AbrB family looped-hinge helix DNA binding protein
MISTLTSKGQITIPKRVRDQLGLKTGDKVEFVLHDDGGVRMIPHTTSLKDLQTILPKPQVSLSLEDMDRIIAEGIIERARR